MTTKTPCAVCLAKGQGYPMTEAELQIHYDANLDHRVFPPDVIDKIVITDLKSPLPRFTEWREDEIGGKPRPWYWFDGLEYDANELVFKGLRVPETPPCDL